MPAGNVLTLRAQLQEIMIVLVRVSICSPHCHSTVHWLGSLDCDCCVAGVDAILEPYFTTLDSIRGHAAVWDPDSFVGAHACKFVDGEGEASVFDI